LEAYFSTVMEKAYAQGITSINISSTTNHPSNAKRSAHTVGRAFDINVINGIHVSKTNPYVDVMQNIILNTPGWMEDYGPLIIERMYPDGPVLAPWARDIPGGHDDHIHVYGTLEIKINIYIIMNKLISILLVLSLMSCNNKTSSNNDKEGTASNSEAQQKTKIITKVDSNSNKNLSLDSAKNLKEKNAEQPKEAVKVSLDAFSDLPKEIEGCSCYFYLSKKDKKEEKNIFVNDFAKTAFVSINGKVEKFILKEHQEGSNIYLYSNGAYDLKTKITKKESDGAEGAIEEGILTLMKGSDILFEKNFIGSCSC